jgi:hypothetical protein
MKKWELAGGTVLNIYADLSKADCQAILQALDESVYGLRQIQFGFRFTVSPHTLVNINDIILASWPLTPLREVLNGYGAFDTLDFLEWLPDLKKLVIDLIRPTSLRPLVAHTKVEDLFLDGSSVSLASLAGTSSLTHFVGNSKLRDLDAIATFSALESLALSRQLLKNVNFLLPLAALTSLTLWKGSVRDLTALAALKRLTEIRFVEVQNLRPEHLQPLNAMPWLQRITFYGQPQLNDLKWLTNTQVSVNIDGTVQTRV